jgi:type I restriction enzyme S subunit
MNPNSTDRSNGDAVLETTRHNKNQTVSAEDQCKSIRGGKGDRESSEAHPAISGSRNLEFTDIAPDWDAITLGNEHPQTLLAMRNGLTSPQDQDRGEYKVSRIETIGDGWIDDSRVRYASNVPEKDVEKYLIKKGDILFSHINSDPHIGKTGFADRDYDDLLHGMNLLLIRANPQVFEPEFLNRVFQYYRDIGVFTSICSRAVNQSSINQAKLKALEVPLPPLPEQKKIAHILSTIQRAIEAQERIIKTTTELKKALMHKLFTEGLRGELQKQTEIGLVPESWEVVEIGDVFKFTSGKTKPKDTRREPTAEQTIPVYGGNGVLGYSAESLLDYEVLILGRVGEYCGCAHLTARISWVTDNALYAKVAKRPVNRTYVRTHFEHLNLNQYSNKMGQPLITQGIIDQVKFGLPSREEQDELAHAFETLDTRIGQIKAKRDLLRDLFRTLIHELMTGKVRVSPHSL